ncbi:MAG: DUF6655 family protein [Pirellulales bacterium]
MKNWLFAGIGLASLAGMAGCGTTRWSDTARTGTEQLLVSTAIDVAVDNIDFSPLAGKDVYFDEQFLKGISGPPPVPGAPAGPRSDDNYLASTLRQQLLAAGVALKQDRKEATYVVEARSGAIGTNRHDVMLGVPAVNLPFGGTMGVPSAIPEIPLVKSTDQKAVAKIALCAYNQKTGEAVWQSGSFPVVATAKDSWVFGAGPWQRGTIYDGSRFAGNRLIFSSKESDIEHARGRLPVTAEAVFAERERPAEPSVAEAAPAADGTNTAQAAVPAGQPAAVQASATAPAVAAATPTGPVPENSEALPAVKILRLPAIDRKMYGDAPFVVASDGMDQEAPAERHAADTAEEEPRKFQPSGLPKLLQPEKWFGAPDD